MKRILSLLLVMTMLLGCAAAWAEGETAATAETAAAVEAAAETEAAPEAEAVPEGAVITVETEPVVLAVVNGKELTDKDEDLVGAIDYYVASYQTNFLSGGLDVPEDLLREYVKANLLNSLISYEVRQAKAVEMGLDQFTAEELTKYEDTVRADLESYLSEEMSAAGITDTSTDEEKAKAREDAEASLLMVLLSMGYADEQSYVERAMSELEDEEIMNRLYEAVTKDVTVTDDEVINYFNALVEEDAAKAQAYPETYVQIYEDFQHYLPYPEYVEMILADTEYRDYAAFFIPEGYRAVTHILLQPDEELMNTWQGLVARMEEQKQEAESTTDAAPAEAPAETADGTVAEAPAETATAEPQPTEEPVTQEMVDAAAKAIMDSLQPKIDEIKQKLADGANFNDLVAEYGADPGMSEEENRAAGYQLHAFTTGYDPAFFQTAMALEKVGDVSEPVLGSNGVHLIYYMKDIPSGAVELTDSLKEIIKNILADEKKEEAYNTAVANWTEEKATVTEAGKQWNTNGENAANQIMMMINGISTETTDAGTTTETTEAATGTETTP